ncbi:histidine triad nucleotide-binding protein [Crenobacter cavernae]|uniref:Histidine triad nucleotide-binding protein n=1 Tax=Crenobacter cavernae TaxID=2290923 RepID=A0ABY0FFE5_9NEIS|nr:histidine triad nucleotide-binding protein [Crenobacter cavernae]RXZ44033.1 histidine triad nucleotide-binding protein [Crenobacter cavernae]
MSDCLFCKIAAGQIPSTKVYEDDEFVAFHDIHPKADVHLLIIPRAHVASLADCGPEHEAMLGRLLLLAPKLAREHGIGHGFQTHIHTGAAGGQLIFHLHLHVIGNRP